MALQGAPLVTGALTSCALKNSCFGLFRFYIICLGFFSFLKTVHLITDAAVRFFVSSFLCLSLSVFHMFSSCFILCCFISSRKKKKKKRKHQPEREGAVLFLLYICISHVAFPQSIVLLSLLFLLVLICFDLFSVCFVFSCSLVLLFF